MQPIEWVGLTIPFQFTADHKRRPIRPGKRWLTMRIPAHDWPGAMRGFENRERASAHARGENEGRQRAKVT